MRQLSIPTTALTRSTNVGKTCEGKPIRWQITNTGWHTALAAAGIKDSRFHDLRHTWASWHRQAGTSCDELKDFGGWKSREMVDRYAKYGTEHLAVAAMRIQRVCAKNVSNIVTFRNAKRLSDKAKLLI